MGGFPAEYGGKMSGVFDITTKEKDIEKVAANFGLDLINTTATVEGPLSEKGSWRLSARRGYVDLILALMDLDEDYKPQYADVYGKLTYTPTETDTLTLNSLYGWDKNRVRQEDVENNLDSHYDNLTVWTRWRHRFGTANWSDVLVFGGPQPKIGGPEHRILMSVHPVSSAPKRNSQPVFWIIICFAAESNGVG